MNMSKRVAFACAAALMTFGAAASARPSDEAAASRDARKSQAARPDYRLALNPQPLPPRFAPDDNEDGRW